MLNKYFRYNSYGRDQRLQENLIVESIKIYGIDVKYMPRTIVNEDFILGEDPLSTFDLAVDVEVYLKSVDGFQGDGDVISKWIDVRDQVTFTMARRRFTQVATEKICTEVGFNLTLESGDTNAWANSENYMLESGSANNYQITSTRPMEGDIIYLPMNRKLYEIKFVEHEEIFYKYGKLYTYDLTCELFDRDSRLNTGNTAIDTIEQTFSLDILNYRLLQQNGDAILDEDGGNILSEFRLEDTAAVANNEAISSEARTYANWSELNPFADYDRY